MKTRSIIKIVLCLVLPATCEMASGQGTSFTYQGQLLNGGSPANGSYTMTFALFDVVSGSSAIAGPVTNNAVVVTNGLFTVTIDFGAVFTGTNYWLEIGVETNGGSPFVTLVPRQALAPTPYAIFANTASNLSGTLPTSQLSGTVLDGQLAHSAVTVDPGPGLTGGGRVGLGNTITLTNIGILSVTGNADITASTVSGAVTLGDTGTNTDTASTLVKRDASGSFSADSITLDGSLMFPTITSSNPDVIYTGGFVLFFNDAFGNFSAGANAGYLGSSGSFNTAVGDQALLFNSAGYYNTAVGAGAMNFNVTGVEDTAIGESALDNNSSGTANTASGFKALFSNTNGFGNTADGYQALYANLSGYYNMADGDDALYSNTVGSYNTAIGTYSLFSATSGSNNIALGMQAGYNITTGGGNIDIGNAGLATDANIIRIGDGQTQTYIAGVLLPPPPVIFHTNFIDGQRYTNTYGWPLSINATVVLNTAAVAGTANESLFIEASPSVGGSTNASAISTITSSAVLHYTNNLAGFVPTNAIFWFTNLSTGTGDSAAVIGGQVKYP